MCTYLFEIISSGTKFKNRTRKLEMWNSLLRFGVIWYTLEHSFFTSGLLFTPLVEIIHSIVEFVTIIVQLCIYAKQLCIKRSFSSKCSRKWLYQHLPGLSFLLGKDIADQFPNHSTSFLTYINIKSNIVILRLSNLIHSKLV